MGERGPKLAIGRSGSVHVAWVDEWAPGVRTSVRYSRSLDGGKSFAGTKATAFAGTDDNFYIVTTAKNPAAP